MLAVDRLTASAVKKLHVPKPIVERYRAAIAAQSVEQLSDPEIEWGRHIIQE
jgi:hypothetical protein